LDLDLGLKQRWGRTLHIWGRLMDRYLRFLDSKDEPYAYNERASVGFLTSAIWQSAPGAIVIEEYITDKLERGSPAERKRRGSKGRRKGRADLWCAFDESLSYICEAKMTWPSLARRTGLYDGVATRLESAFKQVDEYSDPANYRVALVFVVPYSGSDRTVAADQAETDLKNIWRHKIKWGSHRGFRADYYPARNADATLPKTGEAWYPGTTLIGAFHQRRNPVGS